MFITMKYSTINSILFYFITGEVGYSMTLEQHQMFFHRFEKTAIYLFLDIGG